MSRAAEQQDTAAALQPLKRSCKAKMGGFSLYVYIYFTPKLADSEGGNLLLNCAVVSDWIGINRRFSHVEISGELAILSAPLLSSSCINDFITQLFISAPPRPPQIPLTPRLHALSTTSSPLYLYPYFPLRAGGVTSRLALPLRWNSFQSLAPGLIGRR